MSNNDMASPSGRATRASTEPASGLGHSAGIPDAANELDAVEEFIPVDPFEGLREALKPVFDEQRAEWAEHGPAAMANCAAAGIELGTYGGNCPVQVEGGFDGLRFYFRARYEAWQFHVAATDADIFDNDLFYIERDYGEGDFAAGWMPLHEALGFICEAVAEFRAQGTEARQGGDACGSVHDGPVAEGHAPISE